MMKKRLPILLLALIVLLSAGISGCNSSTPKATEAVPASTTAATSTPEPTPAPTVEVKAPVPTDLSCFIDMTWYWIDNFGGRPVDDAITKITGVTLKVTKASDDNQLGVMLASNDLTDLVYTDRRDLVQRLSSDKLSYAWSDLVAQYQLDFPIEPEEKAANQAADGKIYSITNDFCTKKQWADARMGPGVGTSCLVVRQDILDQIGNPAINTLDDFYNVLKTVKGKYPDMMPFIPDIAEGYEDLFFRMFGASSSGSSYFEKDGQVKMNLSDPNYYDALKFLNKLCREGLMPAESLIYKLDQFTSTLYAGKVFAATVPIGGAGMANENFKQAGMAAKTKVITKVLSDKTVVVKDDVGWANLFITKNCKTPEAAIRFVQFLRTDEGRSLTSWGVEGVDWNKGADGYPVLTPEMVEQKKNYDNMVKVVGNNAWAFCMSAYSDTVWNFDPNNKDFIDWSQALKPYYQLRPELHFIYPAADSEESAILTKIAEMQGKEYIKAIAATSEADFQAIFDGMVSKAKAMGMDKLDQYLTARYAEVSKNFK